jgi:hypothetical protein
MKPQKQTSPKPQTKIEPTKEGQFIKADRAKLIAEVFSNKASGYTGDIVLPIEIITEVNKSLRKLKVNLLELTQLDEKPYAVLPHDLATRSHWFMRRFRTSGGWRTFSEYESTKY